MIIYHTIIAFTVLLLSCQSKTSTISDVSINPEAEMEQDVDSQPNEGIEAEAYYGKDTILIREYVSESGHKIRLEGSQSGETYRISVESKQGNKRKFQIADNWYTASHSSILWDNDDYVFVYYGCGTECWGGLVLPLNDARELMDYQIYLYTDSIESIITYLDTSNWQTLIVENIRNKKRICEQLNLCEESANSVWAIDTVYRLTPNSILIKYRDKDCTIQERAVDIRNIQS